MSKTYTGGYRLVSLAFVDLALAVTAIAVAGLGDALGVKSRKRVVLTDIVVSGEKKNDVTVQVKKDGNNYVIEDVYGYDLSIDASGNLTSSEHSGGGSGGTKLYLHTINTPGGTGGTAPNPDLHIISTIAKPVTNFNSTDLTNLMVSAVSIYRDRGNNVDVGFQCQYQGSKNVIVYLEYKNDSLVKTEYDTTAYVEPAILSDTVTEL